MEAHNSLSRLRLHVGQYRFSPLPLSVDLVSLTDPRYALFKKSPSDFPWLYRALQQTMAGYYRQLSSAALTAKTRGPGVAVIRKVPSTRARTATSVTRRRCAV